MSKSKCGCPTLNAGRLRQRVDIQTVAQSTTGEPGVTWSTVASNVAAEIVTLSGNETIRGDQVEAGILTRVTMRYRTDIAAQSRIIHGSRKLNVVHVSDPDGHRVRTVAQCRELA